MRIEKCDDGIHQRTIHETIEELLHYLLYTPDDKFIIPALKQEPINEFMSEDLQKKILEILKYPPKYGKFESTIVSDKKMKWQKKKLRSR